MNKSVDKFLTKQQENVSIALAEVMKAGEKTNLADVHFLSAMLMAIRVLRDKNISNAER